jgi:hypothetical protein
VETLKNGVAQCYEFIDLVVGVIDSVSSVAMRYGTLPDFGLGVSFHCVCTIHPA